MKTLKGQDLLFRAKNKETGEEGWIDGAEFVEYIFTLHTQEVVVPLIKKAMELKE